MIVAFDEMGWNIYFCLVCVRHFPMAMAVAAMLTVDNFRITESLQTLQLLLWVILYCSIFVCPVILAFRQVCTGHK